MAHEIDTSTGGPAIAYVGKTPWHGLGEKLPEGQAIEVWIKAARLEWDLKRLPVQYLVDGMLHTMDERFVIVRSDTDAALSVVSDDYRIVQPKEVLEFYRDLVSLYGYALETSGALDAPGLRPAACEIPPKRIAGGLLSGGLDPPPLEPFISAPSHR
jgi:phage/plasmid-like protein (TIGR03299 family)